MTHDQLVLRAVRWLRTIWKCPAVFAEIATAAHSIPDALGFNGRHRAHMVGETYKYPMTIDSILIECKTSRSDWRRDRLKPSHRGDHLMGRVRYYLTPPGLLQPDEIREPWGLAEVHTKRITIAKPADVLAPNIATMDQERRVMLSALRRFQLGVPFDAALGRFKAIDGRIKTEEEIEGQGQLF